jgi:hypothetical protein
MGYVSMWYKVLCNKLTHAPLPAIVRLLLDEYGADVKGVPPPIVSVVAFEREDIFSELLERGATLAGDIGTEAVLVARTEGLETMLARLEDHG